MYITEVHIIMAQLHVPVTAEYHILVEKLYWRSTATISPFGATFQTEK
jgi:hypothetical protein